MKLKHTFIVLMLLLAILTIASVSAAQDNNITQTENETLGEEISSDEIISEYNLTQDENEPLMKPVSDEENKIGSYGNSNYGDYDDDYYVGRNIIINLFSQTIAKGTPVTFGAPYELMGSFEAKIDGKNVKCSSEYITGEDYVEFYVDTTGIELGEHNLTLKCTKSKYENLSGNYTIYIENIVVEVPDKVILDYYDNAVTVTLPKDSTGTVTIKINGKTVYNKQNTYAYVSLNKLNAPVKNNTCTISVSYSGDENYPEYYKEFNLTVDYFLCENKTFVYGDFLTYDKSYEYEIFGYGKLDKNKLIATIDGVKYPIDIFADYYVSLPKDFAIGNHSVAVTYLGDENYYSKTETATIEIVPMIYINPGYEWFYGKSNYISLTLPKDAKGNLTVYVDGVKCKSAKLKNGKATLSMRYAKPGTYNISAVYDGDDYNVEKQSVIKDILIDYLERCEFNINQNAHVHLYKAKTLKDNIIVSFNGKNYTGKLDGDNLDVELPKISEVGHYSFDVLYVKNNKVLYNETGYFDVTPIYKVPTKINEGSGSITIISSKEDANITVTIENWDSWFDDDSEKIKLEARLVNGKATVSLAKLKQGKYDISIDYVSESYSDDAYYTLNVVNNKLLAKDLTKYYGTSKAFNVKVTDLKGNPIKGKYVTFYINDNYIKQVKTDKKGYATLNINPAPGKYKITAAYSNAEITKNLIIKRVLSLGKLTVKKSAKQAVLKSCLKQGKKVLANKIVTFKFLGKDYKVKTDKNGIARLTIGKAILKKLKVGKTIAYQATYLKDTIKKSAIVLK